MAITDKQAIMVIHQEGMTTSALAPQVPSAHSLFVVLKPLHPGGKSEDERAQLINKDTSPLVASPIGFQKLPSMHLSAMADTNSSNQLWNFPAENTCKGITVTLDNNNMWNEFYRCQTEMILTKQGRRMFPCCRFRISGLEPFQRYTLVMDMHPVDNHRYKWSDRRWETNGKADPHIVRSFVHPESPTTGLDWMQNPVSFYKLKLTNNPLDQEGHIIINSMHRYLPRLHIIPADKATDVVQLNGPDVITFSFPQTEFFAVTAYQNLCITQLKIDYNPFAKGFRDDANNSRACKTKNGLSTETVESEVKPSRETTTLNNLKTLFAKKNSAEKVLKGQSLPVPTDESLEVNGDASITAGIDKSSSQKRSWPEGLSELIKGAHVKVKRISLEKVHGGSDQQINVCGLSAGEEMIDAASTDCKLEYSDQEETEAKHKPKEESGAVTVRNVTETEGPVITNTMSVSSVFTIKNTTASSESSEMAKMQMNETRFISDGSVNVKGHIILSETATETDGRETSQCVVKPLDCGGEVKKKRAEPVPLPLLALFLQQLKSKTRPARPKSKSGTSSLPAQTDQSCKTSVAENLVPSTASLSPSYTTQSNVQAVPSETVTSSILTCTVANTTTSSLSLLPKTSTSLITSPTLPDMTTSLRLSPLLVVTDPDQLEHKADSELDSNTNTVTAPTANVSDTVDFSKQGETPVTLLNTDVSNVSSDASCALLTSSPSKAFLVTLSDTPQNEIDCSNTIATESTADPALDSCTVPCDTFIPEAPYQSPLSDDDDDDDDDDDAQFSPSLPEFSPPSPAPSSPDPFPPGLFSDRPIPPRKSLDPFPSCLLLDRPMPPVDLPRAVPRSFFFTKRTCPKDSETRTESVSSEMTSSMVAPDLCVPKETNQSLPDSGSKKSKVKHRKGGKLKHTDDAEVTESLIPVPMQPNLEDVDGQLFVSFMSKKALEIHLGDEAKEETSPRTTANADGEDCQNIEERIEGLEKVLLRDLKVMKHRQVIHPVLQAVGLKLNLLDLTLAIDLQYLGVCLPIPPPVLLPWASSTSSASSPVPFVSRTGKTTDFTKIKGWRDKFATSSSSSNPGGTSSDAGQKNLSAFCSDMLDEYLESEGKLIDERAASFSQAVVSPVAYQLPTKSTSYVRTLDSVLKKQAPLFIANTLEPSSASRDTIRTSGGKFGENASRKSKFGAARRSASNTDKPAATSRKNSSKKCMPGSSKPASKELSTFDLSPSKKSKIKIKKGYKTSKSSLLPDDKPMKGTLQATGGQDSNSNTTGSVAVGRIPGLSKTLVKLLDVEDGAVWQGKRRTCITEERAAIALSSLVTVEGTVKGSPSTTIKRRAPPCLNDFCRLGCICASLTQERRQHHCGKPQCMLGCDCLRRKVVLLKNPFKDEGVKKGLLPQPDSQTVENGCEVKKRKRMKKAYIVSGPEAAPEPATCVKRLWDQKNDSDSECLFIPTPAKPPQPLLSPDLQQDLENFLYPLPNKHISDGGLIMVKDKESVSCARVRPFCRRNLSYTEQGTKVFPRHSLEDSLEEIEEGELRPPVLSGPTKRLEIVSKCKWATAGSRNVVLRVVCERMAQDRLKQPFWVGKYQIQPISKTIQETEEGSTITYKVLISQPQLVKNEQKKEENDGIKQLEAQLIKTIGKSEVKGLPLLSQVTPAGLLKAEKKPSGAPGQITVNGKLYPQAKLELGQMGALHPANRLAAYITGRVCLDNQNATKTVTTATFSTTTPIALTTTAAATTTSVTSTQSSAVISVKPIVTKPPVGKVFTQVVINHMNSQQQKLPGTSAPHFPSSIKNLINSSSSVVTGITGVPVSSNTPAKTSMAFQAPTTSGPTDGPLQVDQTVPVSGSTVPGKKTFVVSTSGPHVSIPGGGVKLMQPVTSSQPQVPGQKMVFQMLKTANGGTMYRNSNGQLIQLVPLSQFKALNPNFLISKQTTIVRLPTTTTSKPQNGNSSSTITSSTPVTSTTSLIQAQNTVPVHSTTTYSTAAPTVISSVAEKPVLSISSLKSVSSQPSTVNVVRGLLSNPGKIVPPSVLQNPKDHRITVNASASLTQSTSTDALTTQNPDLRKSESNVGVSSVSTEQSQQNVQSSCCSKKASESVVLEDHCYTFETKKTNNFCEKPGEEPGDTANLTKSPELNMQDLSKEMLEFGPIEDDDDVEDESDVTDATLGPEIGGESKAGLDMEEEEMDSDCTELTEDSDMYNDTYFSDSSDQDDLYIETKDSEREKSKQDQDTVDVEISDLQEKDDDELVDIETYEEKDEKNTTVVSKEKESSHQNQHAEEESDKEFLHKKKILEMERRSTLKECFHKLQMTLNHEDSKASRMKILALAQEEILALKKQRDQLVKIQNKLKEQRACYLQTVSQISGKTEKSISQKLIEIITKQKLLEAKDTAPVESSAHTPSVPKPLLKNLSKRQKRLGPKDKVKDVLQRHAQLSPNSKPIDLSITKQNALDCNKEKKATWKRSQTAKPLSIKSPSISKATPHPESHFSPVHMSRDRTRPNILSRNSKSQVPPVSPGKEQAFVSQVVPLVDAVLPCNQIITISNPLQPIGISSLGERQSVTPGVAAVSITVPAISHPIRVENPLSILQSQVLGLGNSPLKINSPVKTVNLPKISSVVSLVPPEKLLVKPSEVLQKTDVPPAIQTQAASNPVCTETQQNTLLTSFNAAPHVEEGQTLDKQLLEVVLKQSDQDTKVSIADASSSQKEEGKAPANSEAEVENLMSLLDELVFLNQQLNNESSQAQEGALSATEAGDLPASLLSEKEAGVDRDDERSLSPLFLRLDEDLIASTTSKDEIDDIPPKVDDLVKVIFGSDSPPNSSESEVVAGASDDSAHVPACHVKSDAPTPPPLLQMKVGGGTTANPLKEPASMSWRPMPKLAPLGLKTQEAGQPKAPSPHVLKPDPKPHNLRSAHL